MRGVAALAAVLVAGLGCGAGQSAPSGGSTGTAAKPATDLRITVWPKGRDGAAKPQRWTLRCGPDGGTLPRRGAACDRLAKLKKPFAPTPGTLACIDLYGGPQQALVTGTHDGRRVWATLSARNGCEIARWNKLKFLLGGLAAGTDSPA
jgi:Subtilisin inhibitor-like